MNRQLIKRIVILLLLAAGVVLFFVFDLDRYFTLRFLKESREYFAGIYESRPVLVVGSYMAIYILVTALSLPGAAVMTLAGGYLFGFVAGTVIVSFASSIGATLACFAARFILGNWVQERFGNRLKTVNEGIDREGSFYLFTMRLIPVIPFFVINLVMGLTKMPLWKFYIVSQVGMLPGTMVYINAGKQLADIESLSGILSPELILSFVLLGIFPLAVRKIMQFVRKKMKRPAEPLS